VSIVLRGTRAQNLSGLTTSSNVSLPVSTNAGDTIIVVVAATGNNSYAGSGAGATWVNPVNKAGVAPTLTVMIGYNTTAGQSTFKFATLGGTSGSAYIAVYSGLRATSSPVLQASSGQYSAIFLNSFTVGNLILFADGGYTMSGNLGSLALNPGGAIPVTYLGTSNYNSRSVDLSSLIVSGTYVNMPPNWSNYYASGVGMIELAALNAPSYTKNSATTTSVSRISLNGTSSQASFSRIITIKTKTFVVASAGSGQWAPPAGVTSATVELWGAGGGGGGGDQENSSLGGGGGGGGGYSIKTVSINPSSTYTYTVGAGGIGNGNGSDGTNGGTTSFSQDGVIIFDATGGGGGGGSDQSFGHNGINGGSNYVLYVDATYVGGIGSFIAGGAGATSLSNGMPGSAGGHNLNGLGTGGTSNNIGQFGSDGGSPGGGGGGSYDYGSQSGNGADGMMIIRYVVNNNYSGGFSMLGIG